ncbi:UDP-glucose/GDP-mannose dehydrogenase family protein [Sporolactobacillus shoreae]|uniref:UDP-glucose 6-dehydrogenase n=1 Tax=Sporolactobacillus shoreae TaxID=1465501 RepID=A0A4Z0GM20_9BACL|nr:UDP-glucose/GDP-mannose dehydrogenase family protein [Sporolactobacillus shoreae]TGA98089.1 UDP-glucose/GDP-mannose dehydrogenase family protein [Sporolactobacillus shoreae]
MKIGVIGAGYVGLTTSAVLADLGHQVTCVDFNEGKIAMLLNGEIPIYEEGLAELVVSNTKAGRLLFSTDTVSGIENHPVILIAVGTPPLANGSTDLTFIKNIVERIAAHAHSHKTIITKSTVPPGTNEWICQVLTEKGLDPGSFDVVSNPEFLKEGTAVHDSFHPHRIVIGAKRREASLLVRSLYQKIKAPVIETNLTGAELIKYASNAFLATKISFINEIARICDAFGADIKDIQRGLSEDPRIGKYFLQAGLGYGGSCFPKDLSSLVSAASEKGREPSLLLAVRNINETQADFYLEKLESSLKDLKGKQITVWGAAFKPGTDDLRSSQSVRLIEKLIDHGSSIHVYDPVAKLNRADVTSHKDMYDSVKNSDALVLATEWDEFRSPDWNRVKKLMRGTLFLDCRNFVDPGIVRSYGLIYQGVARQ